MTCPYPYFDPTSPWCRSTAVIKWAKHNLEFAVLAAKLISCLTIFKAPCIEQLPLHSPLTSPPTCVSFCSFRNNLIIHITVIYHKKPIIDTRMRQSTARPSTKLDLTSYSPERHLNHLLATSSALSKLPVIMHLSVLALVWSDPALLSLQDWSPFYRLRTAFPSSPAILFSHSRLLWAANKLDRKSCA